MTGPAGLYLSVLSLLAFLGFVGCAVAMVFALRRFMKVMPPAAPTRAVWPVHPTVLASPEAAREHRRLMRLAGFGFVLFLVAALSAHLARP